MRILYIAVFLIGVSMSLAANSTVATANGFSNPKSIVNSFPYNNKAIIYDTFPRSQNNKVLSAIAGRVSQIERSKKGRLIKLTLRDSDNVSFWVSTFLFDHFYVDFEISTGDDYRVLGVISDISNNIPLLKLSNSSYIMSSYCLYNESTQKLLFTIDNCDDWMFGILPQNAEISE